MNFFVPILHNNCQVDFGYPFHPLKTYQPGHPLSLISLPCLHEESVGPLLINKHLTKAMISICTRADLSLYLMYLPLCSVCHLNDHLSDFILLNSPLATGECVLLSSDQNKLGSYVPVKVSNFRHYENMPMQYASIF